MDHTVLLLSRYCDNDLSANELQELADWMKRDKAHVDRFVRATYSHSLLSDLAKEQRLQSNAWSHALGERESYTRVGTDPATVIRFSHRRVLIVAVAAALMGVAASIVIFFRSKGPDLVAQVSNVQGSVVASGGQKLQAGAFLPAGESLRIEEGNVTVTFECGAKVLVEGPAAFVVESDAAGTLLKGLMSVRVPTQAIGFAIHTPLLDIIDLGTEFQANIVSDQAIELHVFDGLVEVRLDKRFEHAGDGLLRISEGRSSRFDLAVNEVIILEYDESLKKEF